VEPEDATDKRVRWSSSDPVRVSVINGGISIWDVGTATITAATVDGGHTDSCDVTAISVPVTGVSLPATASGEVGTQLALSADVSPVNATNKGLRWSSGDSTVAIVDTGGNVTFLKKGDVTITARTPDENYSGSCVITVTEAGNLAVRFGATGDGKDLVEDIFRKIHKYLQDNPGDIGPKDLPLIKLGDYIDLPGLFVSADKGGDGQINLTAPPNPNALRLIVVGINSFNPGVNNGAYQGGVDTAIPHIVLQFKDLPGTRRMNVDATNIGGYAESDMRKYLRGENGGTTTFPAGLKAAGVPLGTDTIWSPKRYVANGGTSLGTEASLIADQLWLPTEFEIFGGRNLSNDNFETAKNQAYLTYYYGSTPEEANGTRVKYYSTNRVAGQIYWVASPYYDNSTNFCRVFGDGSSTTHMASNSHGIAPAFCVK
jgi:hypothetical protein